MSPLCLVFGLFNLCFESGPACSRMSSELRKEVVKWSWTAVVAIRCFTQNDVFWTHREYSPPLFEPSHALQNHVLDAQLPTHGREPKKSGGGAWLAIFRTFFWSTSDATNDRKPPEYLEHLLPARTIRRARWAGRSSSPLGATKGSKFFRLVCYSSFKNKRKCSCWQSTTWFLD